MALGGYRKGSGRSKSGYYNGIYCGSTYELCWLIHALDNNVKFSRFEGMLTDGITKYIPDFLLTDSNTIIELKGYERNDSVDRKTRVAESLGYTVVVLRKNDLQHIFDYVANKFGTKKFHTLYDGYKPKYEYKCSNCLEVLQRDTKVKTTLVFCSRRCAGLYNKATQIRKKKDKNLNEKAKRLYYKNRDKVLARRRELYKLKHN